MPMLSCFPCHDDNTHGNHELKETPPAMRRVTQIGRKARSEGQEDRRPPVQTSGPTFLLPRSHPHARLCPHPLPPVLSSDPLTGTQATIPHWQRSEAHQISLPPRSPASNLAITSTWLVPCPTGEHRGSSTNSSLPGLPVPGSHDRALVWPNWWPPGAWCPRGASNCRLLL